MRYHLPAPHFCAKAAVAAVSCFFAFKPLASSAQMPESRAARFPIQVSGKSPLLHNTEADKRMECGDFLDAGASAVSETYYWDNATGKMPDYEYEVASKSRATRLTLGLRPKGKKNTYALFLMNAHSETSGSGVLGSLPVGVSGAFNCLIAGATFRTRTSIGRRLNGFYDCYEIGVGMSGGKQIGYLNWDWPVPFRMGNGGIGAVRIYGTIASGPYKRILIDPNGTGMFGGAAEFWPLPNFYLKIFAGGTGFSLPIGHDSWRMANTPIGGAMAGLFAPGGKFRGSIMYSTSGVFKSVNPTASCEAFSFSISWNIP